MHDFSVDVRQAVIPSLEAVSQPRVIQAKQVQHRRLPVLHLDRILDDIIAKTNSSAINHPIFWCQLLRAKS